MKNKAKMEIVWSTIVMNWLRREGWSFKDAHFEATTVLLGRVGIDAFTKGDEVATKAYIKASRIGSHKTLSRKERASLALLYVNAVNHADYEVNWLPENGG